MGYCNTLYFNLLVFFFHAFHVSFKESIGLLSQSGIGSPKISPSSNHLDSLIIHTVIKWSKSDEWSTTIDYEVHIYMEYIVSLISDLPQDCPMGNAHPRIGPIEYAMHWFLKRRGKVKNSRFKHFHFRAVLAPNINNKNNAWLTCSYFWCDPTQ